MKAVTKAVLSAATTVGSMAGWMAACWETRTAETMVAPMVERKVAWTASYLVGQTVDQLAAWLAALTAEHSELRMAVQMVVRKVAQTA